MKYNKIDFGSSLLFAITILLLSGTLCFSAESEKHAVILDSVEVKTGERFIMGVNVMADRIAEDEKPGKVGFGTFCIPLKYDREAFTIDSVTFINTLENWDEKFTNPKIDTGFVSLSGIYDMGGKDNRTVYSPDKPERIAEIFFRVKKDAKPGTFKIELTRDPRQDWIYLGSSNGINSVTPKFKPGIIVVKK